MNSNRSSLIAYKDLIKPEEDWTKLPDSAQRRKLQNRVAQRAYRRNMKERTIEVEQLRKKILELEGNAWAGKPFNIVCDNSTIGVCATASGGSSQDATTGSSRSKMGYDATITCSPHAGCPADPLVDVPALDPSLPVAEHAPATFKDSTLVRGDTAWQQPQDLQPTTKERTNATKEIPSWTEFLNELPQVTGSSPQYASLPDVGLGGLSAVQEINEDAKAGRASLLHLAVWSRKPDMVRYLLQNCALATDIKDSAGYTPLQRAVMSGCTELVAVFCEYGIDLATADDVLEVDN